MYARSSLCNTMGMLPNNIQRTYYHLWADKRSLLVDSSKIAQIRASVSKEISTLVDVHAMLVWAINCYVMLWQAQASCVCWQILLQNLQKAYTVRGKKLIHIQQSQKDVPVLIL